MAMGFHLGKGGEMSHYTYQASWSAEDQEYVGTALEFRSLSHLAPTAEEALAGIQQLVADVVADLEDNGEPVPETLA
jgi:predicted RNase H-like HicB family nuclease